MSTSDEATPDPNDMTFEEASASLESIIETIEQGRVGLEESIRLFERGMRLKKRCQAVLDQAQLEVERISAEALMADDAAADGASTGSEETAPDKGSRTP